MVRGAFTLIELIFAIVVMAIVMLAFPMILQVDSDNRQQNFAQEAALAASAKLAQVLTYQWDERSLNWDDLAENHQTNARLVDGTNHLTTRFDRNASNVRPSGSTHRRFFDIVSNATALGDDNNSVWGMDDFDGNTSDTGQASGFVADLMGYKRNYQITVNVLRVSDVGSIGGGTVDYNQTDLTGNNGFVFTQADSGGNTNLRSARIRINDESGNEITTLYGYSANIGEYTVHKELR